MENKITYVSAEALAELKQELENRVKVLRPEIAAKISDAREMGDLSENFAYHEAREQQGQNETRVTDLQQMLLDVVVVDAQHGGSIALGSTFIVSVKGMEKTYSLVGENEASPMDGRISNMSPLGLAFMGRKEGDVVKVEVPSGMMEYTIVKVK
ncbi:MAG: transcription elongation factor GreA [Patescibacteria group bacterium]